MDERGVTFRWKDYRAKGKTRHKTMTLDADEFMRRFLLHVLPGGFHRIRHYGLLANGSRKANLDSRARAAEHATRTRTRKLRSRHRLPPRTPCFVCAHCGAPMFIVQTFVRGQTIRAPPQLASHHERESVSMPQRPLALSTTADARWLCLPAR